MKMSMPFAPEGELSRKTAVINAPLEAKQTRDKLTNDELDCAIDHYSHALQLDPEYAVAYFNRGLAYFCKGDLDRAISDWDEAIRLVPDDVEAYYYRGIAYDEKGDQKNAIADLKKALELCGESFEFLCLNARQTLEKLGVK